MKIVDTVFTESAVTYFVIGSAARRAYLGDDPNLVTDFDLLTPDTTQKQLVSTCLRKINQLLTDAGITPVEIDTSLSNLLVLENGKFHLKYSHIDYEIDDQVMISRRIKLGKVEITTLPPETLLHTYSFIGGPFRAKDWPNALHFARFVNAQPSEFDHKLYQPFHRFSRERWNAYPLRKVKYAWRSFVNRLPSEIRIKLVHNVYPRPGVINLRNGFNTLEEALCLQNRSENDNGTYPNAKQLFRRIREMF